MRALLLPLLVLALSAGPGHATPKQPPKWPAAGRCLPAWDETKPCVMISPADAAAIRRAILDALDEPTLKKRPDWRGARKLAERPVTDETIGGYFANVYVHPSHKYDVIRLVGIEDGAGDAADKSYRIDVGRTRSGGWIVLDVVPYSEPPPHPNT